MTGLAIQRLVGSGSGPSLLYMIKAGLPLTINAVIHRANLHQVGAFVSILRSSWRAPSRSGDTQ